MKKTWMTVCCMLTALCCLFGCKQAPADGDVPDNACLVLLPGNATTGYNWAVAAYDTEKLEIAELPYMQDAAEEGMTGVGGTFRFCITPKDGVTDGVFDVVFQYGQSWEGGNKDGGTAAVRVTVSARGAVCEEPVITMP